MKASELLRLLEGAPDAELQFIRWSMYTHNDTPMDFKRLEVHVTQEASAVLIFLEDKDEPQ